MWLVSILQLSPQVFSETPVLPNMQPFPWINLYFILQDNHFTISPLASNFQYSLPLSLLSNDLGFYFTKQTEAMRKAWLYLPTDNKSTFLLVFVLLYTAFPLTKWISCPYAKETSPSSSVICSIFFFAYSMTLLLQLFPILSFSCIIIFFLYTLNQHPRYYEFLS